LPSLRGISPALVPCTKITNKKVTKCYATEALGCIQGMVLPWRHLSIAMRACAAVCRS
jgi:hypothetical protein